jgi:hypothetical protein
MRGVVLVGHGGIAVARLSWSAIQAPRGLASRRRHDSVGRRTGTGRHHPPVAKDARH